MAINPQCLKVLTPLFVEFNMKGSIAFIGKQDIIDICYKNILSAHNELGVNPRASAQLQDEPDRPITSDSELALLSGFDNSVSLDFSSFEGADILVDLTAPSVPQELHNRFNVIYDGGTMEHLFHIPNYLNNLFSMLSAGGHIIHLNPANNHLDHGFYQFSPCLFHDFYTENNFNILHASLLNYQNKLPETPWLQCDYNPYRMSKPDYLDAQLDDSVFTNLIVVQKTTQSTGHKIPQQGRYQQAWNSSKAQTV